MSPAWWTRLCDAVDRLLRHPYRRVTVDLPAYAGWGPTGIPPAPESSRHGRAMDQHRQHWPEEARLCDCTGAPHRMEPPCPDYLRLMSGGPSLRLVPPSPLDSAMRKAQEASARGEDVCHVTPDEWAAAAMSCAMRYDPSPPKGPADLVLATPHGMVRLEVAKPAPSENARRYSEESGTW